MFHWGNRKKETTIVDLGYIGIKEKIMEKNMETTVVLRGNTGI